jgi:E3 ubiquitin-protein ligase TRIP12
MQLCEMLSIGMEDSLAAFPVDAFVPLLVGLLGREDDEGVAAGPDVLLLAARALANLMDVLPSACSSVVHYGAIPCFCARLLTIEYMDLAEQVSSTNLARSAVR